MFDIYSLAKPRVFKGALDGGGSTPGEMPAPDSVTYESVVLKDVISVISEEEADDNPEVAGRINVEMTTNAKKSINVINAASDFGGHATGIVNNPFSDPNAQLYRTEFRPKQGLHNLDFTTPAEIPSDDTPSDDAQ